MANDLLVPDAMSPEGMLAIEAYLECGSDMTKAAGQIGMEEHQYRQLMRKPEIKNYLNEIFMESGFRNKDKFFGILDEVLNLKMQELNETGMGSEMDIMDILKLMHKMKMDEMKMQIEYEKVRQAKAPTHQTNNQINLGGGANYNDLITRLVNPQGK